MKSIALKLPDELLDESGRFADGLRISRAEYIRVAIRRMNRKMAARREAGRSLQAGAPGEHAGERRIRRYRARSGCLTAARSGWPT
jgi:Arc/MetJ-type ribon-helix-helix transcriptional regulator